MSVESVEIRLVDNWLECNWGRFTNSEADPRRGIQPLVLTTAYWTSRLLNSGPEPCVRGGVASATIDGDRVFQHLDYEGKRWTWEIFPCHFADDEGQQGILVGRWPD